MTGRHWEYGPSRPSRHPGPHWTGAPCLPGHGEGGHSTVYTRCETRGRPRKARHRVSVTSTGPGPRPRPALVCLESRRRIAVDGLSPGRHFTRCGPSACVALAWRPEDEALGVKCSAAGAQGSARVTRVETSFTSAGAGHRSSGAADRAEGPRRLGPPGRAAVNAIAGHPADDARYAPEEGTAPVQGVQGADRPAPARLVGREGEGAHPGRVGAGGRGWGRASRPFGLGRPREVGREAGPAPNAAPPRRGPLPPQNPRGEAGRGGRKDGGGPEVEGGAQGCCGRPAATPSPAEDWAEGKVGTGSP